MTVVVTFITIMFVYTLWLHFHIENIFSRSFTIFLSVTLGTYRQHPHIDVCGKIVMLDVCGYDHNHHYVCLYSMAMPSHTKHFSSSFTILLTVTLVTYS